MFHHFHGGRHPRTQGSVSEHDFERILNYIGIARFLSPDTWLAKLQDNTLQESDLCLTFDDGLLCQKEVALPILERYRLKAFWFVYSSVFEGQLENLEIYRFFRTQYFKTIHDFYSLFFKRVGVSLSPYAHEVETIRRQFPFYTEKDTQFRLLRDKILGKKNYEEIMDALLQEYDCEKSSLAKDLWMSNEDLKFLSQKDHQIGLHSYSHPTMLSYLSDEEQFEEYDKNYRHLKRVCGSSPVAMSHPCNSYDEATLGILEKLGIQCGFRSNMFARNQGGSLHSSVFEFPREDHANILLTMEL